MHAGGNVKKTYYLHPSKLIEHQKEHWAVSHKRLCKVLAYLRDRRAGGERRRHDNQLVLFDGKKHESIEFCFRIPSKYDESMMMVAQYIGITVGFRLHEIKFSKDKSAGGGP